MRSSRGGEEDAIRERVKLHFDAGADHVAITPIGSDPASQLRRLAPALLSNFGEASLTRS
jgi:hypothetical protein